MRIFIIKNRGREGVRENGETKAKEDGPERLNSKYLGN